MFEFLTMLAGMLIAVTVMQNGQLAALYGQYTGATMVHAVGLVAMLLCLWAKRKTLPQKQKVSAWMYLGGVIGVGTLVLTSTAFGGVSVTAIAALGLLGQTLTSLLMDQYGLMGVEKHPFQLARLAPLLAVVAGVCVMLFPLDSAAPVAALLALLSGVTTVFARTVNGRLAVRHGAMRSTVMNYVTGLSASALLMLLFGRGEPAWTKFACSNNWFMYLGGACGACLVMLLNLTVPKISAFKSTLLQFIGQILMGLALDTLLTGVFSWRNAAGGALAAIGLALNMLIEWRSAQSASSKRA